MTDEVKNPADEELMRLATEDSPDDEQEPEKAKVEGQDEETDETDEEKERQKAERETRSKRWKTRVDTLTARLRETEQRLAAAEAKSGGQQEVEEKAPDPNDDKYDFGEDDPQYIRDKAHFDARQEIAEERKKAREQDAANAEQAEVAGKISEGVANIEKAGPEKYDDFEEKIADAVEARGGEPLPPLISIGIAVSPAGADIAYRLATDEAASDRIERLAQTNPQAAAIAFGELEAEYLDDGDDDDLNPADPLDMARLVGRERARRKGAGRLSSEDIGRRVTKAPKPAEHRSRGNSGKFEVSDDTEDFAAFERKVMAGKK